MNNRNWFEVSREGLKQLQAGKPKDFVVRELIQNAWDENVSVCHLNSSYENGMAHIEVEDDSPEGFRDITHAFTIFAPTYKRKDPEKRGRFNIGEKQILAICEEAVIATTKGTVVFNAEGRHHQDTKLDKGSIITLELKMTHDEYEAMLSSISLYLPPEGIDFRVNGSVIPYRKPYSTAEATLLTEVQKDEKVTKLYRKVRIDVHEVDSDKGYLYEMGLPVCEIDCPYNADIQQKIPMSIDRNRVSASYLQKVFAAVLNETHQDIDPEGASNKWVRDAMADKNVSEKAVQSVVKQRYGGKVVVANPGDKVSIDDALSKGYRVVYGSELSSEEWKNIRKADAIPASSALFPSSIATDAEVVEENTDMNKVSELTKKIAKRCLGINVNVAFSSWEGKVAAQYGNRTLMFNVKNLGKRFFTPALSARVIDLILHELAHEEGMHTEVSYHQCLSKMAGQLIMIAMDDPEFFASWKNNGN